MHCLNLGLRVVERLSWLCAAASQVRGTVGPSAVSKVVLQTAQVCDEMDSTRALKIQPLRDFASQALLPVQSRANPSPFKTAPF
jgi:hypothetical protein